MTRIYKDRALDSLSVSAVKFILLGFVAVLAAVTILTHLAQVVHMPFKFYAFLCLLCGSSILGLILIIVRRRLSQATSRDTKVLAFILLVGLLGAIIALIIHRPASDDWIYVPDAVYYLQHPRTNMGFEMHFIYTEDKPFICAFPKPYEYGQAVIAYFAGTDYLSVYHIVGSAVVGFLIPLSLFFAASQFSVEAGDAAVGTVITVFLILLLGETHRTFANMSFARAFEGKVLFLSAGIPMFAGFSFDFFKRASFRSWLPLMLVSTAMVGATSSAAVMIPALALVLAVVYLYSRKIDGKELVRVLYYFVALSYIFIYILSIRKYAVSTLGSDSPINSGYPGTFTGQLTFLLNPEMPLTPIIFFASVVTSLLFCKERKKLLVWLVMTVVLYLNPFVAPFVIKNITTPNLYWRMFYLLPFPLTVVIGIGATVERFKHYLRGRRLLYVTAVSLLLLVALHYPLRRASVFRADNRVLVHWPGYKLDADIVKIADRLISTTPPGPMLAPLDIAGVIPMLSAAYPQIRSSDFALRLWLGERGQTDDATLRIHAADFVSGKARDFDAFRQIIKRYPAIRSVVFAYSVWNMPEVQQYCRSNGFLRNGEVEKKFIVVWK